MNQKARKFHEGKAAKVLRLLRSGHELREKEWEGRLAPVIEKLRNAHGISIHGDGSTLAPYRMTHPGQMPQRIPATDEIKAAYYASEHWGRIRQQRMEQDAQRCVPCGRRDHLQVHHFCYRLFREQMSELITVCRTCHEMIHQASSLAFPSLTMTELSRLGLEPTFEDWLLPPRNLTGEGRLF